MAEEDKSTEQEANTEAAEEKDEKTDKKKKETRKSQIVALYLSGMHDIEDLSMVTGARPSYICNVLREAGLEDGYFDLYTSSKHPMNVYSKFFTDKLGFKDAQSAQDSVENIDKMYGQFELGVDDGQSRALDRKTRRSDPFPRLADRTPGGLQ